MHHMVVPAQQRAKHGFLQAAVFGGIDAGEGLCYCGEVLVGHF